MKLFSFTMALINLVMIAVFILMFTVKKIEYGIFMKPYVTAEFSRLKNEFEQLQDQCFNKKKTYNLRGNK